MIDPLILLETELTRLRQAGEPVDVSALAARFEVSVEVVEGMAAMAGALAEVPAQDFNAPDLPGDIEVFEEIGRGGMGIVYRAHQPSLGRDVAVKVMRPGDLVFGEAMARFQREVRAMAKLRHAHIVSIHEVGESEGHVYFVMDLFEESLADLLREKRRPMPVARVVRILEQIAGAVAFVHSHGLVHRDLKPANVLLDENGDAYVADFGLAVDPSAGATLTATGNLIGTPDYMAPEQALGDRARVSERTDVYALGAILYECLTGKAPFAGRVLVDKVHAVAHEEPVAARKLVPAVPQAIELICKKAMAKDPDQRYATAEALAEDLRRFADGRPIEARAPTRWQTTGLLLRRNARSIGLVVASAAAAVLLASPWLGATTGSRLEDAELLWARGEHGAAALFYERAAAGLDGWFSTTSDEVRHRVLAGRARALIEDVSRDPADPELREELEGALDALVSELSSAKEDEFADRQLITVGLEAAAWTLIGRPRSRDACQVIGKHSHGGLRSASEQERLLQRWVAFSKDASPAMQAVTIEIGASFLLGRTDSGFYEQENRAAMLRIAELVDLPKALPALLDSFSASLDTRTEASLRFVGSLGWLHLNEAERWQLSEVLFQHQNGASEDSSRLSGKRPAVRRVLLASIAKLLDFPVELDLAKFDYRQAAVKALFLNSRGAGRAQRDEAVLASMMRAELDPSTRACSAWFERRGYTTRRWIVEKYQAWKDGCQGDFPAAAIRAEIGLEADRSDPLELLELLVATRARDDLRIAQLHTLLTLVVDPSTRVPSWPLVQRGRQVSEDIVHAWVALLGGQFDDRRFEVQFGLAVQDFGVGPLRWVREWTAPVGATSASEQRFVFPLAGPVRTARFGLLHPGWERPTLDADEAELQVRYELQYSGGGPKVDVRVGTRYRTNRFGLGDLRYQPGREVRLGHSHVVLDQLVDLGLRRAAEGSMAHRLILVASLQEADDPLTGSFAHRLHRQVREDLAADLALGAERPRLTEHLDVGDLIALTHFPDPSLADGLLALTEAQPRGHGSVEYTAIFLAQLSCAGGRALPPFAWMRDWLADGNAWFEPQLAGDLFDHEDLGVRRFLSEHLGDHHQVSRHDRTALLEAWGDDEVVPEINSHLDGHSPPPLWARLAEWIGAALAALLAYGLVRGYGAGGALVAFWAGLAAFGIESGANAAVRWEGPGLGAWAGMLLGIARERGRSRWAPWLIGSSALAGLVGGVLSSELMRVIGATLLLAGLVASPWTLGRRAGLVLALCVPVAVCVVSQWCTWFGAYELGWNLSERWRWMIPTTVFVAILLPLAILPEPARPKRRASRVRLGAAPPSA